MNREQKEALKSYFGLDYVSGGQWGEGFYDGLALAFSRLSPAKSYAILYPKQESKQNYDLKRGESK